MIWVSRYWLEAEIISYIELNMEEDRFPIEDTPQVIEMKEHQLRLFETSIDDRSWSTALSSENRCFISAGNRSFNGRCLA